MAASSELQLTEATVHIASIPVEREQLHIPDLEDEEFPADLPVKYDWYFQPASRLSLRRALGFLLATVAALVLSVSIYSVLRP
jgi:hypothetical protein